MTWFSVQFGVIRSCELTVLRMRIDGTGRGGVIVNTASMSGNQSMCAGCVARRHEDLLFRNAMASSFMEIKSFYIIHPLYFCDMEYDQ